MFVTFTNTAVPLCMDKLMHVLQLLLFVSYVYETLLQCNLCYKCYRCHAATASKLIFFFFILCCYIFAFA